VTNAEAVLEMLASAGLGTPGTTLLAGLSSNAPEPPAAFLRIVEYGGRPPMDTHDADTWALAYQHCQVMAHAVSYAAADTLARTACETLARIRDWKNMTGDLRVLNVQPLQTPFDLGPDGAGRVRSAFNVEVTRSDEP
jgi:hypothetical protein